MPDDSRVLTRPAPACRLVQWQPAATPSSLIGWAAVSFPGGWRVGSIPVFRASDGALSVGVPSIPLSDQAGAPLRDQQGKKRYPPIITFENAEARSRWTDAIRAALAAAGIGGAS